MNARYYNPRVGRFLSRDTRIGSQGDLLSRNPYIYVKNNPLKYTDPSGNEEENLLNKFVHNDYVQGTAGFGVGVGMGAWSAVKTVGNAARHPINTVKGVGNALWNIGTGSWNYGSSLVNDPVSTWNETAIGIKNWTGNAYNDFMSKSPYEMGKSIGFGTEKVAEAVLVSKGAAKLGELVKGGRVTEEISTVYRVEGTPNTKILIDASGNVEVKAVSDCLYVNCGPLDTSIKYLEKKIEGVLPDAKLKAFDVKKNFVDQLKQEAVDQSKHRLSPNSPFMVDKTTGIDQFGLTRIQIQLLKESIIQGSGRIINPFK